jgi:hypothetical protein
MRIALIIGGAVALVVACLGIAAGIGILWWASNNGAANQRLPAAQVNNQPIGAGRRATRPFVRDAFRFEYPSGWEVDEKDKDYDPDHDFAIEAPGKSMIMFVIHQAENDLDKVMTVRVETHSKNLLGSSKSEFTKWGKYEGRGVQLRGKYQGVTKTTVRLFAFHAFGKTFSITEYTPDDEAAGCATGFKMIADSFEVTQ